MRTDNGREFAGIFSAMCAQFGIQHNRITVGNSKANGQAERGIRVIKEGIRKAMTLDQDTQWSDHVGSVLMAMRFTTTRAHKFPPYFLISGTIP